MKQANKRPVGRPKIDPKLKVKFKTIPVVCSPDEYKAILLIAKKLKYKSISSLLRSAISKGIYVSANKNFFTQPEDVTYWKYWEVNWNLAKHLEDNTEHINRIKKVVDN